MEMRSERTVTFKNMPLHLIGRAIGKGSPAPEFRALTGDLEPMGRERFAGRITVIHSFPSLDTPVCDLQVREFNQKALTLSPDISLVGVSMDLPFAQKRFCSDHAIRNETILSDHRFASFGINYGVLVRELRLLARAVFIIDTSGIVRYRELCADIASSVDFRACFAALDDVVGDTRTISARPLQPRHCVPCEAGTPALSEAAVKDLMAAHRGWVIEEGKKMRKDFPFNDFNEVKHFCDCVAVVADEQGHHPVVTLSFNKVSVTLMTHAARGITHNDIIMAEIIDEIGV